MPNKGRALSLLRPLLIITGGFSAVLGSIVIVGWYALSANLMQISPDLVPIQYNTALGFLFCGAGLIFLVYSRPRLGMACGTVVAAVGLLTLMQYILGVDLGIDQLLFKHDITVKSPHPGRMAPTTALSFVLSGAALLFMHSSVQPRHRSFISGLLGTVIATLGVVTLIAYLVGLEVIYSWG